MFVVSTSWALAPRYETDYELSQYPIIVVAQWDKAELKPHKLVEGNGVRRFEVFTELNVLRVIKGDIKPGKHTLLKSYGIAWLEDGTGLATWMSTNIPGDVNDVTKPNIWFLKMKRSWDESDKTLYYHVPHYRAVQPIVLEQYFVALASNNHKRRVPKLLSSSNPEVIRRVLRYICGGILPWPYEPDDWDMYSNPNKRERFLKEQARAVKEVIDGDTEDVRALATSVYSGLRGQNCVKYMRSLLRDKNQHVRGIAIGILARYMDEYSIGGMKTAVRGIEQGSISCKVIQALSSWGNPRLVPILVSFLQNDTFSYRYGDDLGIPALKARKALHAITGHWFPYDVNASADAWGKVEGERDASKRRKMLEELLPGREFPLAAELIGNPRYPSRKARKPNKKLASRSKQHASDLYDDSAMEEEEDAEVTVRVKNASHRDLTISKIPIGVTQDWPDGTSYHRVGPLRIEMVKEDFMFLRPGQTTEFEISLQSGFLIAGPESRSLKLFYGDNANNLGMNAWIGLLDVKFGSEWSEERKIEKVEETWPNGNLKAIGQTVNGQRYGEWHFFNQEGDRVKVIHYTGGGGTATYNPYHPDNKGAGKRSK
jgi:hypothetical protein